MYTTESVPALCTTENMLAPFYMCPLLKLSVPALCTTENMPELHTTENVPVLNYWKHAWIMHNWKHASIIHYCQQVHSITPHAHTHFPVWCTVSDTQQTLDCKYSLISQNYLVHILQLPLDFLWNLGKQQVSFLVPWPLFNWPLGWNCDSTLDSVGTKLSCTYIQEPFFWNLIINWNT